MSTWAWCADEFMDNGYFPWQLYVREARRMIGSMVVTQHNMMAGALPDPHASIGLADYATDVHAVEIVAEATDSHTQKAAVEGCIGIEPVWKGGAWEVPYAALTPKADQVTNLLVPVALSASHVAFSTIRLELTWMVLGQSSGVAAVMAAAASVPVQSVSLPDLHTALLKQGQRLHTS
jgi:hypothetical protein